MFWVVTVLSLSLLFGRCTHGESPTDDQVWESSGDDGYVDGTDDEIEDEMPIEASGDTAVVDEDPDFGVDDEDEEVDEEDEEFDIREGSGTAIDNLSPVVPPSSGSRSRCFEQRDSKIRQENYRPQCTESGAFEPMQCYDLTGECWCVDVNGEDIPNTLRRRPDVPVCYSDDGRGEGSRNVSHYEGDDIIIVEPMTTYSPHSTRSSSGPLVVVDKEDEQVPDRKPVQQSKDWISYVLSHPLILAGLIGGVVFILLVIVLVLMFAVYRMRKKDEGSYSLDEPRQSFGYTRARDQEFFA